MSVTKLNREKSPSFQSMFHDLNVRYANKTININGYVRGGS